MELAKRRFDIGPSFERRLQVLRNRAGGHALAAVPGDDDKASIRASIGKCGEFHICDRVLKPEIVERHISA
jgi:hypothetical protein